MIKKDKKVLVVHRLETLPRPLVFNNAFLRERSCDILETEGVGISAPQPGTASAISGTEPHLQNQEVKMDKVED